MRLHVLHRRQIVRRDLREGSVMLFGNWEKVVGVIYDFDEAPFAHQFGAVLALVPLLASSGLATTPCRGLDLAYSCASAGEVQEWRSCARTCIP